jgi:hypothetical protein
MPFGEYDSFADCVAQNQSKDDPEAFCAWLHYHITGQWPQEASRMVNIERRAFEFTEVRAVKDKLIIDGHAAVFNLLSLDLGGFREQVNPGAFAQSIAEDDIYGLFNHNPDIVLGRNRAGTLVLTEDSTGLGMNIKAPDTQAARDLILLIERREVTGASFSFVVPAGGDRWERTEAFDLRTLLHVRLRDVSPVVFPAYPQTDVSLAKRSLEAWRATLPPQPPVARLVRELGQHLLDSEQDRRYPEVN